MDDQTHSTGLPIDQSQYRHATEHEERENSMQYCVSFSMEMSYEKFCFIAQGTLSQQEWEVSSEFSMMNYLSDSSMIV